MSFSEDALALERSFVTTRDLLQALLQQLQERRGAWTSIRPDRVRPPQEMESLSHRLLEQERLRKGLLQKLRAALPTPIGGAPDSLHVNVTRVAAALPPAQSRSLREAADAVLPLARAVRAETALGDRLLRFARTAHESLHGQLVGAVRPPNSPKTSGYDRRARNLNGPGNAGQIVDGRI